MYADGSFLKPPDTAQETARATIEPAVWDTPQNKGYLWDPEVQQGQNNAMTRAELMAIYAALKATEDREYVKGPTDSQCCIHMLLNKVHTHR